VTGRGRGRIALVFLAPALVLLGALVVYPIVATIVDSLQDASGTRFVGLANYRELLFGAQYGPVFQHSVVVSLIYTLVSIVAKLVIGFCMALLLNEQFRGRAFMRGLLFLPWAMPSLIVALTWRWIYEGTPSGLLNLIRIDVFGAKTLVQWLANPDYALWSTIVGVVWQGTPFWCMMLLAGMQAIPDQLYEAAAIDGANAWQRFLKVTLPLITPVLTIIVLFSIIQTFADFQLIYVLTRGGPANMTHVFATYAYQIGMVAGELSNGAAISLFMFPFMLVFTIAVLWYQRRDQA
jgi:multiple sugar transport system permease protein